MGLLQTEIQELRKMGQDLATGKIDIQHVNAQIGIYSQIEKRAKLTLQALALQAKFKGQVSRQLKNVNLIGDNEAIDTGTSREVEMVKCLNTGNLITRAECIDTSGSNIDDCSGCEQNKITKDRLLGRVEGGLR